MTALPDRFWRYVRKSEHGCWQWTGYTKNGYGAFWFDGRMRYAHRLVYGPTTLRVLHSCDNKRCVRRSHLFAGTQAQNMADAGMKWRARPPILRGLRNPKARHPFYVVRLARRLHATERIGSRRLARRFGIAVATARAWIAKRTRRRA